jgi:hypothetical protein
LGEFLHFWGFLAGEFFLGGPSMAGSMMSTMVTKGKEVATAKPPGATDVTSPSPPVLNSLLPLVKQRGLCKYPT